MAGLITCDDIDGPCCDSCHEDYQLGWEGGGYDEMCPVYRKNAALSESMLAHVCCRKVEDAKAMLRKRGIDVD